MNVFNSVTLWRIEAWSGSLECAYNCIDQNYKKIFDSEWLSAASILAQRGRTVYTSRM